MSHTVIAEQSVAVVKDCNHTCEKKEEKSLLRLFIVFIAVGFVLGMLMPIYFASSTTTIGEILGAAFALGSVGASAGLLAAGSYDVIFHGRLEEE